MTPTQYNGWIVSSSFLKRSFAILGHLMVAQLIIAIPLWILSFLFIGQMMRQAGALQPTNNGQIPQVQTK